VQPFGALYCPARPRPAALSPLPLPPPRAPQATSRAGLRLVSSTAAGGSIARCQQLASSGDVLSAVVSLAGSGNAATADAALRALHNITCGGPGRGAGGRVVAWRPGSCLPRSPRAALALNERAPAAPPPAAAAGRPPPAGGTRARAAASSSTRRAR
jgi:hypothetical protein